MKRLCLTLSAAMTVASLFSANAFAQLAETSGEVSRVLACFYECKDGPLPTYWTEVTTLMLTNPSLRTMDARVVISDGNERMLAVATSTLSPGDLDEVNVCRTLFASGIMPPSAGLIQILLSDNVGGTYAWVKNVVGKFFKTQNEPFSGRVDGIGKTGCRVVPPSVINATELQASINAQNPPTLSPILIEGTADTP